MRESLVLLRRRKKLSKLRVERNQLHQLKAKTTREKTLFQKEEFFKFLNMRLLHLSDLSHQEVLLSSMSLSRLMETSTMKVFLLSTLPTETSKTTKTESHLNSVLKALSQASTTLIWIKSLKSKLSSHPLTHPLILKLLSAQVFSLFKNTCSGLEP